ncbi:MAG: glycosyltransferase family 2 protein [Paludibacter sp.]|nr:glycosyltransferase family 2 protein [Paludibacter sp.]
MNEELVSIITPTYNSADFVSETIESIITQTYQNWELLITDDCSTDNTLKILQQYEQKDNRIKIFKLDQNSGAGIARNNSIRNAQGRFIAFCDSDDQWTPDKLEKQIPFMLKNGIALSYSNFNIIDEENNIKGKRMLPKQVSYEDMLLNNYIGCLTAVYDTNAIGKIYMQSLKNRQDWLLWLEILKRTNYALNLNETVGLYRERTNSISANKFKMMKYNWLIYYKYEGFSLFKSCIYIIRYLSMYIKKIN